MSEVTLCIADWDEVAGRAVAAMKGEPQGAFISFATPELLWRTLSPKRWELLRFLSGKAPMSIREAARRVGRDVKAVHGDIIALLEAGILDRTEQGLIHFPYDSVHVDFVLKAA